MGWRRELNRLCRQLEQLCIFHGYYDQHMFHPVPAFALPRLMDRLEQLSAELGLAQNPRLLALAAPLLAEAAAGYDTTQHFVRRFTWLSCAAQTWPHPRDVVLEVEHGERGPNPGFVVTTLTGFDAGLIRATPARRAGAGAPRA